MFESPLALIIVLLAASVFVVTLARRLGLPSILGYVTVGLVLGPHASGLFPESATSHVRLQSRRSILAHPATRVPEILCEVGTCGKDSLQVGATLHSDAAICARAQYNLEAVNRTLQPN